MINDDGTITITLTMDQLSKLVDLMRYRYGTMGKPEDGELLATLREQSDTN